MIEVLSEQVSIPYQQFLMSKRIMVGSAGVEVDAGQIHPMLFPFQRDIVVWAVRKGRAAVFADTGLGKTYIQLEWARLIGEKTLIIAPLSVARQTVRLAKNIGLSVQYVRHAAELDGDGLYITNYEMAHEFDPSMFGAVVLDESGILKSLDGKTRNKLTEMFVDTPYRLCCTATPAPNDYVELGNHAEFLGVCTEAEMRSMFFVNANKEHTIFLDGKAYRRKGSNKNGTEWRLKHSAEQAFFHWLASWAMSVTKPSDLGYDDDGFILPTLDIRPQFIPVEFVPDGQLFFTHMKGIADRAGMRRRTLGIRLETLQKLLASSQSDEQWVIWCGLDSEQRAVEGLLGGSCTSVYGSLSPDEKECRIDLWLSGQAQFLVSKPKCCGFGLNLQCASRMVFFGLNDSWETWYQCIRREYRYGQENPVTVHVIMSDLEIEVYQNVMRKDAMATRLRRGLIESIRDYEKEELKMSIQAQAIHETDRADDQNWTLLLGDSCERMKEIGDHSIDLSVYSPPFADLFTYTDSQRDLGNSRDWPEFFAHYRYIIREVLRVTKPGRLTCVHTSDIPAMLSKDGYIGIRDFPGAVIRAYEEEGWTFIGRAFVQKNPQAQAIRIKSKALLFVQLRKDAADSRPALIDQVLLFRKPGENAVPVLPVANGEMDNETWIEWAHGIWVGIRETDTLQVAPGRGENDEKHICPLQLGTIERCVKLWSNPGETVLSPFAGIGSEGYVSLKFRRRFIGIELKRSYFDTAVENLKKASAAIAQVRLL